MTVTALAPAAIARRGAGSVRRAIALGCVALLGACEQSWPHLRELRFPTMRLRW